MYLGGIVCNNGVKLLGPTLRAVVGPDVVFVGPDGWTPYSATLGAGSAAQRMYISYAGQPLEEAAPCGKEVPAPSSGPTRRSRATCLRTRSTRPRRHRSCSTPIARSDGTRPSVVEEMFRTRVKNGIMGTFRFDKNGDIVPIKWISFDQLRGKDGVPVFAVVEKVEVVPGRTARENRRREEPLGGSSPTEGADIATDVQAQAVALEERVRASSVVVPALGLILVGLVVVWLGVNLAKDWDLFFRIFLIGLTNGSLYALIALGYTLVYGILELINFAHGDVFMIGGMIAATVALSMFSLTENPASAPSFPRSSSRS